MRDLTDKKQRGLDNMKQITEAEAAWVARHKELLERFKQRMASQGDMETFISDQIVEKLEVVAQLEAKIDEKKEQMGRLKLTHEKKVEDNLADHKRVLRSLNEQMYHLEDKLDDEKHTRSARDKMSVDYVILHRRLAEEKNSFQQSMQDFESASTRDIDRLIRKEMIRNQGAKGAYKEQLLAEKRKSGAKSTHDYVQNLGRIKQTSAETMAVLQNNERLMQQRHDLKHDLDMQKLSAERAKRCNEELERYLRLIVQQYFDKADQTDVERASSNTLRVDKDLQVHQIKAHIADSKKEAEGLRTELRQILEASEILKQETRATRQEAHDMFAGDSVAWAITAALPAIRSQSDDVVDSSSRMMETDYERNENDLELLLSALHLSSRRDQSEGGSFTPLTPRHGNMTPRAGNYTPRHGMPSTRGSRVSSRSMG